MSASDQRSKAAAEYRKHYKGARWRNLRRSILAGEPLCRRCRAKGRTTEATIVDHIKPHRGDLALFFDPSNLQAMCRPCHDSGKQSQERSGRGYDAGVGTDGLPIDPRHPFYQE